MAGKLTAPRHRGANIALAAALAPLQCYVSVDIEDGYSDEPDVLLTTSHNRRQPESISRMKRRKPSSTSRPGSR